MLAGQCVTIPLAWIFQFKVAYIFTYITGYCYGVRYFNNDNVKEKKKIDFLFYSVAAVGLIIRIVFDQYIFSGVYEALVNLVVQWIKLFQGAAVFMALSNLISVKWWEQVSDRKKRLVRKIADCSFELYLVHEFFTHDIYTQFLPGGTPTKVILSWVSIVIAAGILLKAEEVFNKIYRRLQLAKSNLP